MPKEKGRIRNTKSRELLCFTIESSTQKVAEKETLTFYESLYLKKESDTQFQLNYSENRGSSLLNVGVLRNEDGDWIYFYRVNFKESELQICPISQEDDITEPQTFKKNCKVFKNTKILLEASEYLYEVKLIFERPSNETHEKRAPIGYLLQIRRFD